MRHRMLIGFIILSIFFFLLFRVEIFSFIKDSNIFNDRLTPVIEHIEQEIALPKPLRLSKLAEPSVLTANGVFSWTNIQREQYALNILEEDTVLNKVALSRAQDMFKQQYFDHISPQKTDVSDIAKSNGYSYISIGENLALGNFANDQTLVQAWMESPGHRANILRAKYTEIGIAVMKGMLENKEIWIAVQVFAHPITDCPAIDTTLKKKIDLNEAGLLSLQEELAALKIKIAEDENRQDAIVYNNDVKRYNNLVEQYNTLRDTIALTVDSYNNQVKAFNLCLRQ